MLEIADTFKKTRVYQEAKEEGRLEGILEARAEEILEGKLECVPRLLEAGLTLEQIAKMFHLDLETVRQAVL
jgi:predicted transposase/invertase (TIGR01784 family)